jgi:hypothetical protein
MCTPKDAPKLRSLREDPMVALTVDTEVHPPKILLVRGRALLDFETTLPSAVDELVRQREERQRG